MTRMLTRSGLFFGLSAIMLGASALFTVANGLEEVPRDRTFVSMGNDRGSPVFLDPGVANPYRGGVNSVRWTIMLSTEPLFWYNNLTDEVVPWIGESVTPNADFTVYTVKIKDGVKWSDGKHFTAEDIKFTYDMLIDNGKAAGDLRFASSVARNVASVDVIDPLTVQINLTESNPRYPFVDLYAYFGNGLIWVPKHIWERVEDKLAFPNYDPKNGLPVTTGAWRLVEYNENQIFLDRHDNWWGAKTGFRDLPDVERIVSIPFGNTDRAIKLITEGTVDFAPNLTDVIFVRQMLGDNPDIRMFSGKEAPYGAVGWWTISLFPNNRLEKWSDARVRRALNYAIDQQQIVDFVYEGLNPVNLTPFPDFGSLARIRGVAFDKAAEYDFGRRDLDKVAEFMTSAGYEKNGNGFWTKEGKKLSSIIHGIPLTRAFGPFVARQLQEAGFDIEFVSNTDSRTLMRNGVAEMAIYGHRGAVFDQLAGFQLYLCRNQDAPLILDRWCNPEYDVIVAEMEKYAPGDPKLLDLGEQALDIFYREAVEVPLMEHVQRFPMRIEHWTNWPQSDNPYILPGMSFTSGTMAYMLHNLEATSE